MPIRARGVSPAPALVVFVGNDPTDLARFEAWLGCRVDGVSVHSGQANWSDWSGSVGYVLTRWRDAGRRLFWSVPLIPDGASLADGARGRFDARYRAAARAIAAGTPGDDTIPIRTGWEFNGDYMPWAAATNEAAFVETFRRFVARFRAVSPRFRFEWAPSIGVGDPPAAYPGDDVVDVIGMDAYYNTRWDAADPAVAWHRNVARRWGFRWLEAFAAAHGKRTAYGEWGVMSPDAGAYVAAAARWFGSHAVVYQSYWNSNSNFEGRLSEGRLPQPGAAYRRAFGQCRKAGMPPAP